LNVLAGSSKDRTRIVFLSYLPATQERRANGEDGTFSSWAKASKIGEYVKAAQTDYRDILYWAEYYQNDPMLRDREAKQVVEEIIAKWGKKSE